MVTMSATTVPDAEALSSQFQSCFSGCTTDEINKILPFLEYQVSSRGADLWKEGDSADFMGFLLEGKLVVKREARFPGKFILLAVLGPGSIFGETAIIAGQKRSVTLAVGEDSHFLRFTGNNAQLLFDAEPQLAIRLLKNILVVTSGRLNQAGIRLGELL